MCSCGHRGSSNLLHPTCFCLFSLLYLWHVIMASFKGFSKIWKAEDSSRLCHETDPLIVILKKLSIFWHGLEEVVAFQFTNKSLQVNRIIHLSWPFILDRSQCIPHHLLPLPQLFMHGRSQWGLRREKKGDSTCHIGKGLRIQGTGWFLMYHDCSSKLNLFIHFFSKFI